jgi:hypothetical protein
VLKAKKKERVVPDRATARREFLALRPARNPKIEWEDVDGKAVLTIPRANNWRLKLVNLFFPVPETRKVVLDSIGSLVWRHCDGENSIDKLSRELQREYNLGGREAELSLQQFFKDLGRRGYVGFVTERKTSSE